MIFEVGDVVRVVQPVLDDTNCTASGLYVAPMMLKYVGGVYEIIGTTIDDRVILGTCGSKQSLIWHWDRYCLELVDENNINFDGVEELL